MLLLLFSLLRNIVPCIPTWSGALCEAQASLEFMAILLLWPPAHWDYRAFTTPSFAHKCFISTEAFTKFLHPQSLLHSLSYNMLKHLCIIPDGPPHIQSTVRPTDPALPVCDAAISLSVLVAATLYFPPELATRSYVPHLTPPTPATPVFSYAAEAEQYIINTGVITLLLKLFSNFWHRG